MKVKIGITLYVTIEVDPEVYPTEENLLRAIVIKDHDAIKVIDWDGGDPFEISEDVIEWDSDVLDASYIDI